MLSSLLEQELALGHPEQIEHPLQTFPFFVDLNLLNRIKSARTIIIPPIKASIIELPINSTPPILLTIKAIIHASIN